MEASKKRGFAAVPKDKHLEYSSKGGKRKVAKGYSTLPAHERSSNASIAAQIRWANVREDRREKNDR